MPSPKVAYIGNPIWPQDAESAHAVVGQIQRPHEATAAILIHISTDRSDRLDFDPTNILQLFRLKAVLGFNDFNNMSVYFKHPFLSIITCLSCEAVHIDPSARFLESTSVLHRDFRRFDQKQMS